MKNYSMPGFFNFSANKKKSFAVLIDPDKLDLSGIPSMAERCNQYQVDYIFVGGSLLVKDNLDEVLLSLKKQTDIPLVLFPGNQMQISRHADAILFLSLISGRNAEMLIGKHVIAAPFIKKSKLDVIPTGYMLIESGKQTTASYMSGTTPLPYDKCDVALCTAMAGEMLGMSAIYLDAGSGALKPVSQEMISQVKENIEIPLIVGGGIRSANDAQNAWNAGADIIVIGNAIESNPELIQEITKLI
jgi:phosphoglycerol geranylgeranyltransferase